MSWGKVWAAVASWSRRAWLSRLEPNLNKRGQFAPAMQRQWLSIVLAIAFALLFEWALFGLLAEDWTWPWVQVRELNGTGDSLVQPAIALLTPVIALVTAVFAYRKSTIALAESQRADVAAFQQRFIDAAKLLADPNASTRIAGATAMGSLARDWVENRQECVNVLCGYLRVKPLGDLLEILDHDGPGSYVWHGGEDVVRLEVVAQLQRTFAPGAASLASDLPVDLNLDACWLPPGASLAGSTISGLARFSDAVFSGHTSFDGTVFSSSAEFGGARFAGAASFGEARFCARSDFALSSFEGPATFARANFQGATDFDDTEFADGGSFEAASFAERSSFTNCIFYGCADFFEAQFGGNASFTGALFSGEAVFELAEFRAGAFFGDAQFSEAVPLSYEYEEAVQDRALFRLLGGGENDGDAPELEFAPRGALGPLAPASNMPAPTGFLFGDEGTKVGDAEWSRAALDDETS